eukprot:3182700-Rhodomonas_salina.2
MAMDGVSTQKRVGEWKGLCARMRGCKVSKGKSEAGERGQGREMKRRWAECVSVERETVCPS